MSDTPEESLALCYTIDAQSHWNAQHVNGVQQCGGDSIAPLNVRTLRDSAGNLMWVACFETSIRTQVEVDANIGEREERAGREWYWAVLVVGIER
jgi:hypothetical protein